MAWAEWSVVIIVKELNGILELRSKDGIGCWNNKRQPKLDVGNENWLECWNDKDKSWIGGWNEGWMDPWDWQLCDVRIQAALNSHDRRKKKRLGGVRDRQWSWGKREMRGSWGRVGREEGRGMWADEEYKWKRGWLLVSSNERITWKDKEALTGRIRKPRSVSLSRHRLSVSWVELDFPRQYFVSVPGLPWCSSMFSCLSDVTAAYVKLNLVTVVVLPYETVSLT